MIVGLLPLDSRPCNSLWPVELAGWSGNECLVPQSGMDWFRTCASAAASRRFLVEAAGKCDALVVSIDHLCFGSLLGSREYDVDSDEALGRLRVLQEIRKDYPSLRIFGYNVIMRSSISSLTKSDLAAYRAMTEYSYYSDLADTSKRADDIRKALEARDRISESVIGKYEAVRKRNLGISKECIEYVSSGVLSSLMLLQEDSELFGFHKKEQRELLALKKQKGLDNVWLHNGADEGAVVSVMRSVGERAAIGLELLDGEQSLDFVARYEDRPFSENVRSYLSYAGISIERDSDWVLAIATPFNGTQSDMEGSLSDFGFAGEPGPSDFLPDSALSKWTADVARRIKDLVDTGKRVYLLDVSSANGGNMLLMRSLASIMPLPRLAGYSAWNTATNSLGSILAQIVSDQIAGRPNKRFLWERFLDDLVYQSAIRPDLNRWVEANGWDEYCLAGSETSDAMRKAQELYGLFLENKQLFDEVPGFAVSFPWNRTFEINLRVDLDEKR